MSTKHKDPVTGDELTAGEWISWHIQGIIRRWLFLITLVIITIIVWSTNNPTALTWWNLCASLLAIVIETIVGIAMFSQTKRDAQVLREVRAISARVEQLATREEKEILKIDRTLQFDLSNSSGFSVIQNETGKQ